MIKKIVYRFASKNLQHKLKKIYFAYKFKMRFDKFIFNAEKEIKILHKFVEYDDVVLDIGANIGYYTVVFSKLVGPNGKVHAFEPIPENFDILNNNIKKLKLKNSRIYNFALMERDYIINMIIPIDHNGVEE